MKRHIDVDQVHLIPQLQDRGRVAPRVEHGALDEWHVRVIGHHFGAGFDLLVIAADRQPQTRGKEIETPQDMHEGNVLEHPAQQFKRRLAPVAVDLAGLDQSRDHRAAAKPVAKHDVQLRCRLFARLRFQRRLHGDRQACNFLQPRGQRFLQDCRAKGRGNVLIRDPLNPGHSVADHVTLGRGFQTLAHLFQMYRRAIAVLDDHVGDQRGQLPVFVGHIVQQCAVILAIGLGTLRQRARQLVGHRVFVLDCRQRL